MIPIKKKVFMTLFSTILLYNTNIYAQKASKFEEEDSSPTRHSLKSNKSKKHSLKKEEKSFLEKYGQVMCIGIGGVAVVLGVVNLLRTSTVIKIQADMKEDSKEIKVQLGDLYEPTMRTKLLDQGGDRRVLREDMIPIAERMAFGESKNVIREYAEQLEAEYQEVEEVKKGFINQLRIIGGLQALPAPAL